jgi:acetyltransferase-like isoleucine patch superfamily enzyme
MPPAPPLDPAAVRLWWRKWRWYTRADRPWNRARLQVELARRQAFARGALHGNALTMLREGRLEIGPHAYFEPGVWLTSDTGRIRIGGGSILNLDVMVAAVERVEIGEHCLLANGCLLTDGNHRVDDPTTPMPWQGFTTKGPTVLGDNVWLGAHVVVTSGVTVGERSVIGANSVVTADVPPYSIAAGVPARVLGSVPRP